VNPVDHTKYAAALARAVDLLRRSREAGDPQKAALSALVAFAAERSITLRYYDGFLTADSELIPTTDPRLAAFAAALGAQGIAELVIARGAEPIELLALATGLGGDPGHGRIRERLRDAGSLRIMVVMQQALDAAREPVSVSGAFEKVLLDEASLKEWNKFLDHGASAQSDKQVDVGFKEQGTGEILIDINAAVPTIRMAPRASIMAASPAPPASPSVPPPPPPPVPLPVPPPLNQPPTLHAASPLAISMTRLLGDPYGAELLTRLTMLSRQIQDAFAQDRVAEAIDTCTNLIDLESKAPAAARNTYGVILRRMLTRSTLTLVVPYLLEPRRKNRSAVLLTRGGDEATGLLVGLLVEAHTMGERTTYLEVLRGIPTGLDQVLSLLGRQEWQVIRNIAELAGETRLEEAVPYLASLLTHGDDRVRRMAIVSLARIGSVGTVEPLRTAMKTGTPELRALIAGNIGGAHARPLTAPLAAIADEEDNPDVIRACYKAIGRIGTPEARQALDRAVNRKGLFSRKDKVAREAAEEVLKTFGTPGA
jgi:hypothetical protein